MPAFIRKTTVVKKISFMMSLIALSPHPTIPLISSSKIEKKMMRERGPPAAERTFLLTSLR
jgi:hypothetical protein